VPDSHPHSGIHRLAVVGVGTMGGSLALAAQMRAKLDAVVGYDADPEALELARSRGVITEVASTAGEAAAHADLVVISTPVRSIVALVEKCAAAQPPPRLITDMGSTKSAIMDSLSPLARGAPDVRLCGDRGTVRPGGSLPERDVFPLHHGSGIPEALRGRRTQTRS
jgi:cyclohexadieny/prephenate dehydrogenase